MMSSPEAKGSMSSQGSGSSLDGFEKLWWTVYVPTLKLLGVSTRKNDLLRARVQSPLAVIELRLLQGTLAGVYTPDSCLEREMSN